jgi:carbon storage regulator
MLVLTRKTGERIVVNDSIVVEVLEVHGNRVRIGVRAPSGIPILRQELVLGKDRDVARQDVGASPVQQGREDEASEQRTHIPQEPSPVGSALTAS